METIVIAEAGANHNRDFKKAIELIDVAKKSNSNIVKFQTYSSETLYVKNTPDFAGYKNINKLIKDIELPREWQKELKDYCDSIGIEFLSTPFDEQAVDELVKIGVKRLKISGFESTDFRFVDMVASTGLPLIISMGIGFKSEYIDQILEISENYKNDITFLHCNNAYPTPISDTNLKNISKLSADKRFTIGFSDHTTSVFTPSIAVALGAKVIEKHFTLNKKDIGPDHHFALDPNELCEMNRLIEMTEMMLKSSDDEYSMSEKDFIGARRSVVAKCDIKKGELFTKDNITTKRPYINGVSASSFFSLIGKKSEKNYKYDDFI